jgi:hypothetical protein
VRGRVVDVERPLSFLEATSSHGVVVVDGPAFAGKAEECRYR